jgi:hypothetical protein
MFAVPQLSADRLGATSIVMDTTYSEHIWEDNLLERKVESDLKDLLKTIVAFANTVRPGHVAVIVIGERNNGSVEGVFNPDNIQKTIRAQAEKIYPDVLWKSFAYQKEGKWCVRVEIEYSGNTPHFAGPAYVRRGSESVKASEELFQQLVDIRLDPLLELNKWIGKTVTVVGERLKPIENNSNFPTVLVARMSTKWQYDDKVTLVAVNTHWVTLRKANGTEMSEPVARLIMSFDDDRRQLKLIVLY